MSNISKRRKDGSRAKIKSMGDHKEFLKRITKTLYYGELPTLPCLSLPVTEISCAAWSEAWRGRSLRRLHADAAARVAREACVSPCALVLAILYLERLKRCNADYLCATAPADLFLVSLMVSNKFLQDDGEDDEVICAEWAASGGLQLAQLKKLELEFLSAIDWNVFVSEQSFEAGLRWLERQVALRQARARGFFTYGDLAAACDAALLDAALALAAAVALLASAAALLLAATSAASATTATTAATAATAAPPSPPHPPPHAPPAHVHPATLSNGTADAHTLGAFYVSFDAFDDRLPTGPDCCRRWLKHQEATETKRNWFDAVVLYDWKSFEPWWSKTSVMNWLYQTSLITPLQRWLEKINLNAELLSAGVIGGAPQRCERTAPRNERRCVRQWLNLSKLSVFVASVSDR